MKNNNIALEIKSNIDYNVDLGIMNPFYNGINNATAKTLYEFDLSSEDFVLAFEAQLNYNTVDDPTLKAAYYPLSTFDIEGVVQALNAMNILYFYFEGTTIYTFSDTIVVRSIQVTSSA